MATTVFTGSMKEGPGHDMSAKTLQKVSWALLVALIAYVAFTGGA
ncbi:MAG: hypothetical protein AAF092_08015 [Pseudomonadota bacterium]